MASRKSTAARRRAYKDVAERVIAAMTEWNAALAEAHEHPQVRVHMKYSTSDTTPVQFGCEVTRITKHVVPLDKAEPWKAVYHWVDWPATKKRKRKSKAIRKAT